MQGRSCKIADNAKLCARDRVDGSKAFRKYSSASKEFNQQSLVIPKRFRTSTVEYICPSRSPGISSCRPAVEKGARSVVASHFYCQRLRLRGRRFFVSGSAYEGGPSGRWRAHPNNRILPPSTATSNDLDQHRSLKCASCMHPLSETGLLIRSPALVVRF